MKNTGLIVLLYLLSPSTSVQLHLLPYQWWLLSIISIHVYQLPLLPRSPSLSADTLMMSRPGLTQAIPVFFPVLPWECRVLLSIIHCTSRKSAVVELSVSLKTPLYCSSWLPCLFPTGMILSLVFIFRPP